MVKALLAHAPIPMPEWSIARYNTVDEDGVNALGRWIPILRTPP